ncbi:MAG: hypothetical protein ACE3JK_02790 [Sporolactobacillus sp.]
MKRIVLSGAMTVVLIVLLCMAVYARGCAKHPIWIGQSSDKEWAVVLSDKNEETGIYLGTLLHNRSFKLQPETVKTIFLQGHSPLFTTKKHYTPGHPIDFIDSEPGLDDLHQKVAVMVRFSGHSGRVNLQPQSFYWPWQER